jgi:hypothetical protein
MQTLEVSQWMVNVVKELPTFAHGRVALLGDAVNAFIFSSKET